jgi:predicted transcriptional regulator
MKTITINVSEPIYRSFQDYATREDRTTSELIRQAMEEFYREHMERKTSLRQRRPFSAGGAVKPVTRNDDVLGEMLDDVRD